jgi:hypothetical protein
MSHFAKVLDGKVLKIIAAEADFFDTFIDSSPGEWIQTDYNTRENIHYGLNGEPDGNAPMRGNYAGIGYIYDIENDVFYSPQPGPEWTLNTATWLWELNI